MVVCAVTIFVMIANLFMPFKASATSIQGEFVEFVTSSSYNNQNGIPYLPSYFQNGNFVGWANCVDDWNEFCAINLPNMLYYTIVSYNSDGVSKVQLYIIKYTTISSLNTSYGRLYFSGSEGTAYNCSLTAAFGETSSIGYNTVSCSYSELSSSSYPYLSLYKSSSTSDVYYAFGGGAIADTSESTNANTLLGRAKAFGEWLLNTVGNTAALQYTHDYGTFYDNLLDINRNALKGFLGCTDDDIDNIYRAFLNGDYGDLLLGSGESLTSDEISLINNTLNGLYDVYTDITTVTYNVSDSTYNITPSTAYNDYTYAQTKKYYYDNIYYNTSNTYSTTVTADLTTTNNLLGTINSSIINVHNQLAYLNAYFDSFLDVLEVNINNILVGLGLGNIITAIDGVDVSINALAGALGGIIAGAIGVAWADIKGELQLLIDDINFNIGDITIGDSIEDGDDTTTNNITVRGLDSLFDSIFDDLKLTLKDIFGDVVLNVTIDGDSSSDDSSSESEDEDDFLEQLADIIVVKIPLFGQCVELLEPVTTVCIDDINTNGLIADTHNDMLLTTNYSVVSYYSNDSQLDFSTIVETSLFGGIVSIRQSADNSIVGVGVTFEASFYGYVFTGFYLDISYFYNNYRVLLSNFLLFLCYVRFAWSVIHRTSKLFGHSSSDSDAVS